MFMRICVDAALSAALYIPEERTPDAQALLSKWTSRQDELVAPDLWAYEVVSIVYKCIRRGRLLEADASETLDRIMSLPIRLVRPSELHSRAMQLASALRLPAPYDAHYLALAEIEAAEFWTLDKTLYNTVHSHLAWVHLVGGL